MSSRSGGRERSYRPALDGVRAVAVLAVIAYHVNALLPAGFLGVDVFFVLSGYLITALLVQERLAHGRLRLAEFWARRARRLLPALLIVLAVTAVVTAYSAPVATFDARRSDIISTLLYAANWHFIATDQSYFATFSGVSPLRHMWSLAIEEQFYLVWPLVIGAALAVPTVRRNPAKLAFWILAAALASAIAMAVLYDAANPSRAYFGTDTRAHALLVGCALALLASAYPRMLDSEGAAALARRWWPLVVALLAIALLTFDDEGGFYYHGGSLLFALTVAAALWVVEAAPRSAPAALLSTAPLRWVGMTSYGLYLWHWPILVWIGDPRTGVDPLPTQLAELGLTFAIAALSFYAVERPIREGRAPWIGFSRRRLVLATVVSFELVWFAAILGTTITSSNSAIAGGLRDRSDRACPPSSRAYGTAGRYSWCARAEPATPRAPVIATAGDSTARALDPGLMTLAQARGWGYVQAAQGGCSFLPLLLPNTTERAEVESKRECVTEIPRILADVAAARRPDIWIVADRVLVAAPLMLPDGRIVRSGPERETRIEASLRATLRRLMAGGAQVVIVKTPPVAEPADCVLKTREKGCDNPSFTLRDVPTRRLDSIYRRVLPSLGQGAAYIPLDDVLCPRAGRCRAAVGGVLARYDAIHYSATFSRRIVPVIVERAGRAGISFR
ncbi:MAG: acyltransferase family protein, partial [Solirubrobacteraceae bacterium]